MSILRDVVSAVGKMGSATVDELVPETGFTRTQVMNALKCARDAGLLHTRGWASRTGKGFGAGRAPSAYYPGPKPAEFSTEPVSAAVERLIQARPPASVWELAHGLQIAGEWPPRFDGARVYVALEEEEVA